MILFIRPRNNNTLVRICVCFIFLAFAQAILLTSCADINLFAFSDPNITDVLDNGSPDEVLLALNNPDIIDSLISNSSERSKVISRLGNRVSNSSGEKKIKNMMALTIVQTNATELRHLINTESTEVLLTIAGGSASISNNESRVNIINKLFKNVSDGNTAAVVNQSLSVFNVLNSMGDEIENNGNSFPNGYDAIIGNYAEQALGTGVVQALYNAITARAGETKEQSLIAYIKNPNDASFIFPTTNLGESIVGTSSNPNGMSTLLEASGFGSAIDSIRGTT